MQHVYLLRSISYPAQTYVGCTSDLAMRLAAHNAKGSAHTSKYTPWALVCSIVFQDKAKAEKFESYLKSGSGRAFAKKHLW